MDDQPIPQAGRVAKFDHHDDTDCWALNLSEDEFAKLQLTWRFHRLPQNLFYPERNSICAPYPVLGWKGELLRLLGIKRCYSPKQWEVEHRWKNT